MHDVAIIGAGPVGATLALALAGCGRDVVVLDPRARGATLRGDRTLALSHGSRLILERLEVWRELAKVEGAVTPILEIDVSQARGFGVTRLTAAEQDVPALGYTVSYVALQRALDEALDAAGVAVRFGSAARAVRGGPVAARVEVDADTPGAIEARLVAVADGAGAQVDGVGRDRQEYGQCALVASVWRDAPHGGIAFERFTPTGPIALLPERDHYGLVWTVDPARAAPLIAIDERAFLAELARAFGARVAGFTRVAGRKSFPLALERARSLVGPRIALIGNAAQQLHPVAGQGFNLGLRDAWALAQSVLDAPREELGSPRMLSRYAARRRVDRSAGIAFTHGLVGVFGAELPLVGLARGAGLALLDIVPPAKRAFARAMLHGLR
ncbi:MAG: FAD-dependent monooxygenase [Betaproteobacteria bacterium]|jgi:2-octaprenyl-6-methoxyphenol hydroxylase|nr:FAD-dependent monooxygenase [Betaproteobacteria bacterium]